jgi:hypothetical protein
MPISFRRRERARQAVSSGGSGGAAAADGAAAPGVAVSLASGVPGPGVPGTLTAAGWFSAHGLLRETLSRNGGYGIE